MICILAGNYREAERWASSQRLDRSEWFFGDENTLLVQQRGFHVLHLQGFFELPQSYMSRIEAQAAQRKFERRLKPR